MSWTHDDLTAVRNAIRQLMGGVKSVSFRDRTVTFRDLDELQKLYQMISAELGGGKSFDDRSNKTVSNKDLP
jgi:hypothetical protein